MAKAGYLTTTAAAVALVAATAKTVVGVAAPAQFGIDLQAFRVEFDGTSATATPVTVELMSATFATNAPGTNSTTNLTQVYGRTITAGFTGAYGWTTEPTVLTLIERFTLTPAGGFLAYDWPLGRTPDTAVSTGLVLRCTAAATVNVTASLWYERT